MAAPHTPGDAPMLAHLTVRARRLPVALTEHEVASWMFERLRRTFPSVAAALLMPSHPHVLVPTCDPADCWRGFKNLLAGLRRSNNPGASIVWEPVGPAQTLVGAQKIRRMVRYIALNPCRAGLVDDPLSWPWSTHRDVMGAIADPWVTAESLGRLLAWRGGVLADSLHRYVSSAPSVNVAGMPPPRAATPTRMAERPLDALVRAAAAASRGRPADIEHRGLTRALFVGLAMRHGWNDIRRLAELCGVAPRSIQRHRAAAEPAGLQAADICLGDARLQHWQVDLGTSRVATFDPRPAGGRPRNVANRDV